MFWGAVKNWVVLEIAHCRTEEFFGVAGSVEITPFKAIFSVAEGSRFEVNCSSQRSVSWSSDPANAMPDNNKGQVAGSDNVSTLLMENVQKSNEGRYRCSDGQSDASFQLRVFTGECQSATLHDHHNDNNNVDTESERFYPWVCFVCFVLVVVVVVCFCNLFIAPGMDSNMHACMIKAKKGKFRILDTTHISSS